ncbi:GAF domain-containing protein, partial [Desulfosporosinus burensis]
MALELASVKEFVQQVVEAIAVALGIDVMVFDPARTILAGSGITKAEIGTSYNENSLTGSILASGHPIITRDPGRSDVCKRCLRYGICPYLVVVAYPIKIESDILGSFCLVATDEKQKSRLLSDEEGMMKFLDKACQMIGSVINERRVQDQLNTILKRYDNVVNSIHEGIIVTDEKGRIIHLNRSALELLGITPEETLNQHITKVFYDFSLTLNELAKKNKIEIEITYQKDPKHKKKRLLATVMPIHAEEGLEIKGATISMRNLKEVQSYAAKLVGTYSKYEFKDIVGQSEE